MKMRTRRHQLWGAAGLGWSLLILTAFPFPGASGQEGSPTPGASPIVLVPAGQSERFEPVAVEEGAGIPWRGQAELSVTVQSLLPVWGVGVDEIVIHGPRGRVPSDRLWIVTERTAGTPQPLREGVPLAVGDPTSPVLVCARIEFRPQWLDPPGSYEITTVLRSFAPLSRSGETGGEDLATTLGRSEPIVIRADLPEIVSLSLTGASLSFPGVLGPGRYPADRKVDFSVSTNALRWAVVCQAAPLQGSHGAIPGDRLLWERRDGQGRLLASGSFAENAVLMQGDAPAQGLTGQVAFSVQVLSSDHGGDYQGEVSLTGMSLP